MKLQVFLWSCFLFAGGFANPSHLQTEKKESSDDLHQLLAEFTDANFKWSSLNEKFEKVKWSECREPENAELCKAIEKQAAAVAEKHEQQIDNDMRILTTVLSSLQEKIDKLERKMESGVGGTISTRDYIQAMKALERRLHYFQAAIASLGKDMKMPMKYVDATEDEAVEIERSRPERASGRFYEDDDGKYSGKNSKKLAVSHKKLVSSIERLEEIVKDLKACGSKNEIAPYKNSIFKDMKDMLEDISEDIKLLRKMSTREMNENEKILRKINKKLERELRDDDKDDEALKRSLKKFMVEQRKALEKTIKKALTRKDDNTDDDTDDSDEKGKKDDTDDDDDEDDEDDDSCDDSDGCDRKKKGKDTDSDDDDDDDYDGRKKGRNETDESDDDDDTDDTDDTDYGKKSKKKKNRENLTKKYSEMDEDDVELLRNSASDGPIGKNKFIASLFGIPPYIGH